MNQEIKNIGNYIRTKNGYLVNSFKEFELQSDWITVSKLANDLILKNIKKEVSSIYLRGSVANGTAVKKVSDIDIVVILKEDILQSFKNKINNDCNLLLKDNSFVTHFDIAFYLKEDILNRKEKVLIKLRSHKMFGEDLTLFIPELKPGEDIFIHIKDLEEELKKLEKEISLGLYNKDNVKVTIKWISKRIIRAGMEIVSEREQLYTRDLYKCWESFSKYYPNFKDQMFYLLDKAINPTNSTQELSLIVNKGFNFLLLIDRK